MLEYVVLKGVEENGVVMFEIKMAVQMPEDAFICVGYGTNRDRVKMCDRCPYNS